MNREFTIYRRLVTNESADVVYAALEHSLRMTVGGSVHREGNTIWVVNGKTNVNFGFVAEIRAQITLTQPEPGIVDISGVIRLSPNSFFWICAVAGFFCLWFLWVFNIFYFVMDPRPHYQTALDRMPLGSSPTPFGAP
ncbi:MAG TPA: hypothetical protein VHW00_07455 [Thermoanaerobaculia bacterium]|nr:hypothetical protein [Thermoanaerobaculia bacterium]